MAKPLDPAIGEVLKKYGAGKDAVWDCHGVWVVYHKALEKIAAQAGVTFDPPQVLECDSIKKVVAICVNGKLGDRSEWSIGEAAPQNNKNSYPFAMAEKRAKDRVIMKLIGLHGLAYSEEEADDFKYARDGQTPADLNPESDQRMADNVSTFMDKPGLIPVPNIEDPAQMWEQWSKTFIHHLSRCQAPDEVDQWIARNGVPLGNLGAFSEKAYDHIQTQAETKKDRLREDAGFPDNTILAAG